MSHGRPDLAELEEALTAAAVARHRGRDAPSLPFDRPPPTGELEDLAVEDLIDGRRITVRWSDQLLCFAIDVDGSGRLVLGLDTAGALAGAIQARLDEWTRR